MVLRKFLDVGKRTRSLMARKHAPLLVCVCLSVIGCTIDTAVGQANSNDNVATKDELVLLVEMSFERGQWQAQPLKILPCGSPSKPDPLSRQRSAFELLDPHGDVLFRRYIINPRIILVEDPKEQAKLLSKLNFTLAVPFVEGSDLFRFFEREQDYYDNQQKPELKSGIATASLSDVTASYENSRTRERASCQIRVPEPEDTRILEKGLDTAISADSLASLIANDQHLLIERALERKLNPDELRRLVYGYREQWHHVKVNQREVDRFLKQYAASFNEKFDKTSY